MDFGEAGGKEQAPYPVNLCMKSIRRHTGGHPVIVLDQKNYRECIQLSDFVLKKLQKQISLAYSSDILRIDFVSDGISHADKLRRNTLWKTVGMEIWVAESRLRRGTECEC